MVNEIIDNYLYQIVWQKLEDMNKLEEEGELEDDPLAKYKKYYDENHLNQITAQVIVENGKSVSKRLMGVFGLDDFEKLKSEKFLNFSQKNKKVYEDPKEQITVSIFVKNIEEITVNFFDIDILRYHQT